jgi:hypothetical protein
MAKTDMLPSSFLMKGPHEFFDGERVIVVQKKTEFVGSMKENILDEFSQFFELVLFHSRPR